MLDAFADRTATPSHLLTRELFALARSRLSKNGTLYLNLDVAPEPDRLFTRADRALRSVFAWCEAQGLGAASGWRNRVYACPRTELDGDATVYSDASGCAEVDAVRAGRRAGPMQALPSHRRDASGMRALGATTDHKRGAMPSGSSRHSRPERRHRGTR